MYKKSDYQIFQEQQSNLQRDFLLTEKLLKGNVSKVENVNGKGKEKS